MFISPGMVIFLADGRVAQPVALLGENRSQYKDTNLNMLSNSSLRNGSNFELGLRPIHIAISVFQQTLFLRLHG